MKHLIVLLAVVMLGACSKPPYTNIDNEQLTRLIAEGVPVYDVRRADEWRNTGVISGSRLLTFVDDRGRPNPHFLPKFTSEVGKDDPVIVICRTGNRTDALARHLMEQMGYTKVYNVQKGIQGWRGEQRPVVQP